MEDNQVLVSLNVRAYQWGVETAYLIIDDFMLGPRDLRGRMNFADITIGALYL
jgi:hypothetical protein